MILRSLILDLIGLLKNPLLINIFIIIYVFRLHNLNSFKLCFNWNVGSSSNVIYVNIHLLLFLACPFCGPSMCYRVNVQRIFSYTNIHTQKHYSINSLSHAVIWCLNLYGNQFEA